MSIEQQYPPRPDLQDPDTWASIITFHQTFVRVLAPRLGLDAGKIILGSTLSGIYGDDPNCFYRFHEAWEPWVAPITQRHLVIRMDAEIATPEIPEDIRDRLIVVKGALDQFNWFDKTGYYNARDYWKTHAADFVQRQVALRQDLRDAVRYDLSTSAYLHPYYDAYLHQGILPS